LKLRILQSPTPRIEAPRATRPSPPNRIAHIKTFSPSFGVDHFRDLPRRETRDAHLFRPI
jgi:hypothetical protein